jgi:ribosome-associated protein
MTETDISTELTSDEKLQTIQDAMEELKAQEISVLPVREKTQMTDYMIVCSGTSNIHVRAIADKILEKLKEHDIRGVRREGYQEARWVLMDFGDVVAHVFDPEDRKFYRLEDFWQGKPLVSEGLEPAPAATGGPDE